MIRTIVFEDEITLWWEKSEFAYATKYDVYVDGVFHGSTQYTHYTMSGLYADTSYEILIQGNVSKQCLRIKTKPVKRKLDVTKAPFFAVGDGETVCTQALQAALDACKDGDCVYFPKGSYLSGALDVRSNTEIYLEEGAVIQGLTAVEAYLPKINSRFEGIEQPCYRSLINMGRLDHQTGCNCRNVVIRGKGSIRGGGVELRQNVINAEREFLREYLANNQEYVKTCENEETIPGRARGRLINISNTDGVVLSGISLAYGPSWTIHFAYSKNVVTYGCSILSTGIGNGDGWDPDSSEDCAIFDCDFYTGDDAIAIKSGKNPEGNVINRPTRNVYVFNCRLYNGHSGVAVGSEMSGGVENVYVWDCDFGVAWYGIHIKATKKRGGYVKNVQVRDSVLSSVFVQTVEYNDDGESAPTPPVLQDYLFENITLKGITHCGHTYYVYLHGFTDDGYHIKNVCFDGVKVENVSSNAALEYSNVGDIVWKNVEEIS